MSLRPGELFAGYTIERELGSGGMGAVYLAHHPRLPRSDALKLLRTELCDDPSFVGRFEREADTVARLDHPNIVSVYDRGSADGQLWISMRFIDGTNAEKALADYEHGMPPERAVRIVGRVASALDYAHRHHLLHRDVKPANILLAAGADDDESERVFLSDFGVAKAIGAAADRLASLTSVGSVVATLDYASPEQIKAQTLDHRSDIYALGCVLYKLLTGSVPFPGESIATRVYGHLNSDARAPSSVVDGLPAGFDEVVATAMAKEPDDRYPTCRALALAAQAVLTGATERPPEPEPDDGLPTTVTDRRPEPVGSRPNGRPSEPLPPWLQTPQAVADPRVPHPPEAVTGSSTTGPRTSPDAPDASGRGIRPAVGPFPAGEAPPRRHDVPEPDPAWSAPPRRGAAATTGASPRRTIVLVGALVAALLVGVGTWAALSRGGVAGTGGPASTTSSASPADSPEPTTSTGTSSAAPSSPGPVPGLPHSTPLPEPVLISSRVVDGVTNLFQVDAADGTVGAQLTTSGLGPAYPILSPDRGTMIFVQVGGPNGPTLLTAAVDGTGERNLLPGLPADCATFFRPAWYPSDQTQIALPCLSASGVVRVHLMSVETGAEQQVIDPGFAHVDDLAFAPDGSLVTYWAADSGQGVGKIYVQPTTADATPTMIVEPVAGSSDADPSFSADGSKIAFRRVMTGADGSVTAHIVVVGVDGSNPTAITDGPFIDQDPIWSPDGTRIAFKSNRPNAAGTTDNQIWVVGADGSGLRELPIGSPGHADGAPAWGLR
ncbi:MAG TPA: protein kinase [Nakamurella sp.]